MRLASCPKRDAHPPERDLHTLSTIPPARCPRSQRDRPPSRRYGGVWLDSTAIVNQPIEHWADLTMNAVQGWEWVEGNNAMENWGEWIYFFLGVGRS